LARVFDAAPGLAYPRAVAPRRKLPKEVLEAFQAWGRRGGKAGAEKRWKGVSSEDRKKLAENAARARWAKRKQK
jgi:hypothetical protein